MQDTWEECTGSVRDQSSGYTSVKEKKNATMMHAGHEMIFKTEVLEIGGEKLRINKTRFRGLLYAIA
jgi:hypothetical protein